MTCSPVTSLLLVLTVLLQLRAALAATADCIVADIQLQPNYDLDQFMGLWYEMQWLPAYYEDFDSRWDDYSRDYIHDDVNILAQVSGRPWGAADDEGCSTSKGIHCEINQQDPARWTYNRTASSGIYRYDEWIIATDYSNWAVQYGCDNYTVQGACSGGHAWVWSRQMTLSTAFDDVVDEALASVCLNITDLALTPQRKDCAPTADNGSSRPTTTGLTLLAALLLTVVQASH